MIQSYLVIFSPAGTSPFNSRSFSPWHQHAQKKQTRGQKTCINWGFAPFYEAAQPEEVDQKEVHVHTYVHTHTHTHKRNALLWAFKAPSTISHSHIATHCSPMGGSWGARECGNEGILTAWDEHTMQRNPLFYMWTCGISTSLYLAVYSKDLRRLRSYTPNV